MAYGLTQSVNFDIGSTEYLHRTDSFGLSTLAAHTFEAWIKVPSQPGTDVSWGIWTLFWATAGLRIWYQDSGGTKQFMVMRHGWFIQQQNFTYNITLTNDTWYHVAYTYDGSSTTELFINGTSVASSGLGNSTGNTLSVTSTLGASAGNGFPESPFNGNISLARLWNTVRTGTELTDNMCNVFGGSTSGLVAEWSLDGVYTSQPSNTYPWTANNTPTFQSSVPSVCGLPDLTISVNDNVGLTDVIGYYQELLVITESTQVERLFNVSVSDALTANESVTLHETSFVSVFETIAITEDINSSSTGGGPSPSVFDSLTVSESVTISPVSPHNISVFDAVSLTETTSVNVEGAGLTVSAFETITLNESIASVASMAAVSVNDTIALTEFLAGEKFISTAVFDSLTITESVSTDSVRFSAIPTNNRPRGGVSNNGLSISRGMSGGAMKIRGGVN